MTNEEAIESLESIVDTYEILLGHGVNSDILSDDDLDAIRIAIEALKEMLSVTPQTENKGEWIKVQSGDKDFPESIVCSKCGNENSHFDFNEHAEPIGKVFVTSKFCPNCGADMRGDT